MSKLSTILCNGLWLLSVLPGWIQFRVALFFPKQTQQKNLRRILRNSVIKQSDFARLSPQSYEEIYPDIERLMNGETNILTKEPPLLLEPTGGSTAGTKLIPYTRALKKEFQRAINPWIAGLFLNYPSLLFGRHYWCITPATPIDQESAIPIGFDTDAAYLGRIQQFIARHTLAVPSNVDQDSTLLHLLNTPDLRLISIWHPSLLTLMLQTLETRFDELVQLLDAGGSQRRAQKLRETGCIPPRIWPKLKIISCWNCQPWIDQLQKTFPATTIQPKGLVATEGIASIPQGTTMDVAAIRSHYYEFECEKTNQIIPLGEVEDGKTYHLILTTGGGLYRYKTNDLIKIDGFLHQTPRIHFLTRNNMTSDLVGEKITLAHAEQICRDLPFQHRFSMIAPEKHGNQFRYVLYIDTDATDATEELETYLEMELCKNYQYMHARNLHQLASSMVRNVKNLAQETVNYLTNQGKQVGNIKLSALRNETHWNTLLTEENHPGS